MSDRYGWQTGKFEMEEKIDTFLNRCSFKEFFRQVKKNIIGQDEQLVKACYNVYLYLEALADGKKNKSNFIISAPSGSGKTEFFRTVKKVINDLYKCDLPVIQIDLAAFTEVGYKGRNVSEIVKELAANGSDFGEGIVFLDEFDKKLMKMTTSDGCDLNAGVQHGLLTMVEGCNYTVNKSDEEENVRRTNIDTEYTLFIGLGAFQSCREDKVKRDSRITFGFSSQVEEEKAELYTDIEYQDILDCGCCAELLGRFSQVINLHRLSDEAYKKILREYVSNIDMLPANCQLMLTKEAENDFLLFSSSEMGIREMKRRVDETIQPGIIKLMLNDKRKNGKRIIIKGYLKTEEKSYRIVKNKVVSEDGFEEDDDTAEEDTDEEMFRKLRTSESSPFA